MSGEINNLILNFLSASMLASPVILLVSSIYYIILRLASGTKYFDILLYAGVAGIMPLLLFRDKLTTTIGGKAVKRKIISVLWVPSMITGTTVFLSTMTVISILVSLLALVFEMIPFPLNLLLFTSVLLAGWIPVEDFLIAIRSAKNSIEIATSIGIIAFYITLGVLYFPSALGFLLVLILALKKS